MRNLSHLTLRYIFDRTKVFFDERRHPNDPWLTRAGVDFLDDWLKSSDVVLEFGSGRSTPWLGLRVGSLISVEHDKDWYERVSRMISRAGLEGRVDLRLCRTQEEYLEPANELPGESLDLCLVDGAYRDECANAVLPKIKRGGVVVVDNVNWFLPRAKRAAAPNSRTLEDGYASPAWQRFCDKTADWRYLWTCNGVTDTAIFFRPSATDRN